jgi:hypothetical protein
MWDQPEPVASDCVDAERIGSPVVVFNVWHMTRTSGTTLALCDFEQVT